MEVYLVEVGVIVDLVPGIRSAWALVMVLNVSAYFASSSRAVLET